MQTNWKYHFLNDKAFQQQSFFSDKTTRITAIIDTFLNKVPWQSTWAI